MGSLRLTLCTALLAVTALTTPAAHAAQAADTEGTTGVTTTPSSPAPGTDITLRANGCTTRTGTATSAAFVADVRLTATADTQGTLTGETRVRSELKAGSYDVQVTCGDTSRKSVLTVVDQNTRPSPHTSPVAPVQAGGGGTARLASVDEARAAGPGTIQQGRRSARREAGVESS